MANYDPVQVMEQQIGKKHEEWFEAEELQYLRYTIPRNISRQEYFKSSGDIYTSITWSEFLTKCVDYNRFTIVYKKDFVDREWRQKNIEEEVILIHMEKGIVIYANSYCGKTKLNKIELYGEVQAKENISEKEILNALDEFAVQDTKYGTIAISLIESQGMISKLNQLNDKFEFVVPWNELPDINFLTYIQEDSLLVNIFPKAKDVINKRKLSLVVSGAKQMMGISSPKIK